MRLKPSPRPFVVRPFSGDLSLDFIRTLRSRRARDETGLFLAEGARFLAQAVDAGATFAGVVFCPLLVRGPLVWTLVTRLEKSGVPVLRVRPEEYRSISLGPAGREVEKGLAATNQGVPMVLRQQWEPLPVTVRKNECWLGVESVQSPGNLGTLLRSGDAAGATGLIVFDRSENGSPSGPDPYDPHVVRATMGSLFAHRMIRTTHRAFRRWSGRSDLSVVGATPEAATDYRGITYRRAVVLMLGHERTGLSEGQRNTCDRFVNIPMLGGPDSLNLAMAGTLILYEVHNQRHPIAGSKER